MIASSSCTATRLGAALLAGAASAAFAQQRPPTVAEAPAPPVAALTDALEIQDVDLIHRDHYGILAFQVDVRGKAGATVPDPIGRRDGAPSIAYLFRTDLPPSVAGFRDATGTLALMAESHPDYDDTPLFDENGNGLLDDDGAVFHAHWVVLQEEAGAPVRWSIAPFDGTSDRLPPTAPGLPYCIDSPGFGVVLDGDELRIVVPVGRIAGRTDVKAVGMTARLSLHAPPDAAPTLRIDRVYDEYDPAARGLRGLRLRDG